MKRRAIILMAFVAALLPLAGRAAADTSNDSTPPPLTITPDAKLSRPARDVVKMTASGVSDDVIKAYVASSPYAFSLSADNIIHMQGVGVSGGVTTEMLNHDKKLSDQAGAMPPQMNPGQPSPAAYPGYPYPPATDTAPPAQPQNSVSTYTIPQDSSYYSDLSPYGNWSYLNGYGWCWEPAFGPSYAYYPWNVLSYGRWWNCPGRGWVWFPGAGFRGGFRGAGFVGGTRGFVGGGRFGFSGGFRSSGITHFSGGFRSGSVGFSRSTGGRSFGGASHSFAGGGHR